MKVTVKDAKIFEAITVEIKITSKDELFELYNKCRLSSDIMYEIFNNHSYVNNFKVQDTSGNHTEDLGQALRRVISERRLD